jgi:hypothetical protein
MKMATFKEAGERGSLSSDENAGSGDREKMKRRYANNRLLYCVAAVFMLLYAAVSFAATTTYTYDDWNRKVTVEQGTPGALPTYSISGIVIDNNGSPMSGVTISLTGTASASMPTDSNGFYGFTGLNNGPYAVTPGKTGYSFAPASRNVTVNGADVVAQNFTGTAIPPPSPPYNLTATTISSSQINLSWADGSNNEDGFKIERKIGTGGVYEQIGQVGANVTTYPDTGLSGNTTYYYRVRAYNGGGDSAYSDPPASATTLCGNDVARIVGGAYYSSLQAAYNAATNGSVIQTRAGTLIENVSINRNISVTLQGGYDCAYTTNSGNVTSLRGQMRTFAGGGTITITNFNLVQQ